MDSLNEQRKNHKIRELEQLEISRKIWEEQRKNFKFYDLNSFISKSKNDDDLSVLMEKFSDWVAKSKDESKKELFMDLFKCVLRIHSYCFNIETSISQAGAMYLSSEELRKNTLNAHSKETAMLINQIKQLERNLENAKKQIEFHENNGKRK